MTAAEGTAAEVTAAALTAAEVTAAELTAAEVTVDVLLVVRPGSWEKERLAERQHYSVQDTWLIFSNHPESAHRAACEGWQRAEASNHFWSPEKES